MKMRRKRKKDEINIRMDEELIEWNDGKVELGRE